MARKLKLVFEVHDMDNGNAVVPKSQYVCEFSNDSLAWPQHAQEIAEAAGNIVARSVGLQTGIAPRRVALLLGQARFLENLERGFESA